MGSRRTILFAVAVSAALLGCKGRTNESSAGSGGAGNAGSGAGSGSAGVGSAGVGSAGSGSEGSGGTGSSAAGAPTSSGSAATAVPLARPASVTDAQVALADKLAASLQKLGRNLAAAGTDCANAAAALQASATEVEPLQADIARWEAAGQNDPAVKTWFRSTYGTRMVEALAPLEPLAKSCANDKAFQDAMSAMKLQ